MSAQSNMALWHISNPLLWPKSPRWMSYSTLLELESCPRRWALNAADYPHVWEKRGYPTRPHIKALEGTVVHLALRKILHEIAKYGCTSLRESCAFSALKELGGYTAIIVECIDCALSPYNGNPRATPILDTTHQRLTAQVPEFRIRVQRLLSRISLASSNSTSSRANARGINESGHQISHGSHTEVELKVLELGWHGVADLITINSGFCEIRDFKTGIPKPQHEFQLRIYGLLWALDRNLNPSGRLADKLVLSYDENDVEYAAPREEELHFLKDEIRRRTEMVLADLRVNPPEARPSAESCVYCSVRQLCEDYWKWNIHQEIGCESLENQFADLQIRLLTRHGPTSWDGIVEASSAIKVGWTILLKVSKILFKLEPGQQLRILNAKISIWQDEQSVDHGLPQIVITVGTNTEVFLVPGK